LARAIVGFVFKVADVTSVVFHEACKHRVLPLSQPENGNG